MFAVDIIIDEEKQVSRYMWLSTRRSFPVLKILLIVSVPQPDTMSAATTALDYEDKYIALI